MALHIGHVAISGLLVASAAALGIGLHYHLPPLIVAGVMSGWLFSVVAVGIAFIITVLLIVRIFSGKARHLLRHSWLGVLNGIFAIAVAWWMVTGAI